MVVTIKAYEQIGAVNAPGRLLEERQFSIASEKPLNAARAKRILRQAYPSVFPNLPIVISTEKGWWASKAVRPTEVCSFHFVWRSFYLTAG